MAVTIPYNDDRFDNGTEKWGQFAPTGCLSYCLATTYDAIGYSPIGYTRPNAGHTGWGQIRPTATTVKTVAPAGSFVSRRSAILGAPDQRRGKMKITACADTYTVWAISYHLTDKTRPGGV